MVAERLNQFLLLSLPRSGSAMLCSLLDSHPDISCQHERIRHDYKEDMNFLSGPVKVGHCQYRHITDEVLDCDLPKIFLNRDDYVAGAISEIAMGHAWANGLHVIRPDLIERAARERRERTERLLPYADYVISYEEITNGSEIDSVRLDDLCLYLGVEPLALKTMTQKNTFVPGVMYA